MPLAPFRRLVPAMLAAFVGLLLASAPAQASCHQCIEDTKTACSALDAGDCAGQAAHTTLHMPGHVSCLVLGPCDDDADGAADDGEDGGDASGEGESGEP